MKMRRKCRVWWPKQLSSCRPSSSTALFGWFVSCSAASLDVVVAHAADEILLSKSESGLQSILHYTNENMPESLQEKSAFSTLGHSAADFGCNGQLSRIEKEKYVRRKSNIHDHIDSQNNKDGFGENYGQWSCGCQRLDELLEQCRQASIGNSNWMQFIYDSHEYFGSEIHWIPRLHHIHWNGRMVFDCDVHVIVYDAPRFGVHHFLLCFGSPSEQVKNPVMKPKWVNELHQKQSLLDLDAVILAINSSYAAKMFFDRCVGPKRSSVQFSIVCMFSALIWNILAISVASFSTVFYIILQFLSSFASYGLKSRIYIILPKAFSNTWKNIRIRCCQILYWPIFLGENYHRSLSCVEYAEKAALHKHATWSSIVIDVFLGSLIGLALLFHAESACLCVLNFAHDITNNLLRSGCVWLMGVPAGFKLNTELAGILGMISFNAIQVWSTLWFYVGFLFIYFIKGLAISGFILGVTIPAALMIDLIALATLHVSSLNWFFSLLYSRQIQALAAIWRLFRGRKWNPLRQRLDSYDYTVEQHIVGSLLFAPLLLLLPTTSVFYIFFTILNSTICLLCILVEIAISVIHATPYCKIFLWLMSPRRFPSGTWLEIVSSRSNATDYPEIGCLDEIGSHSTGAQQREDSSERRSYSVLVSFLHSNRLNIGQILSPHYKNMFSGVCGSFITSSACGLLTGRRMPSTLGTDLPAPMPWISIPYKEYWRLCHNSVIACMQNSGNDLIQ